MALAASADAGDEALARAHDLLLAARPTAVNLRWALDRMQDSLRNRRPAERAALAYQEAAAIAEEDVATNRALGEAGLPLIEAAATRRKGEPVQILTHCNAGWLATVDWGTATAPIYLAFERGLPIHVWVDETRPRNQGASLTAWELQNHGVPHTVIADNVGGHLMQHGMVDLCIVGTDRTTATGDVANKIGTYLKALAARDNHIPFFVALPFSTIDWNLDDGSTIPIEERDASEVTHISGKLPDGSIASVLIAPERSPAANFGFDVTPARLVSGFITERGVTPATRDGLVALYPEHRKGAAA
jgi:methylthioribose-1-phosphate isomerase